MRKVRVRLASKGLFGSGLLRFGILAMVMTGMAAIASAQNDLVGVLRKKYVITQTTLNRSQIASPGTVMAIQANGVNAEPWDTLITFDNPVVDGSVQQRSKVFGLMRSKNLLILKPGDKVYVTKIEGTTSIKSDTLRLAILSCDPLDVDGGVAKKRFSATISFKLPQGGLQQTSPEEAQRMVEAVLVPDAGGNGGTETASAAPPAPAAPPPPPPPAAPVQTQTIALGQTIPQVVAAMGQPLQIIDLGAKKTYKYKDLKVVFVNGKVSDVQ